MSEAMVQVRNVVKSYVRGKQKVEVLHGLTLDIPKGDFVGRDALVRQKEQGIPKKLVGFTTSERAFPRWESNVAWKRLRV